MDLVWYPDFEEIVIHKQQQYIDIERLEKQQALLTTGEFHLARISFLLQSCWSRTFPLHRRVREYIQSGKIGKPLITTGRFMVNIAGIDRVFKKDLGGGGLLDIGCYLVSITNEVFPGKPVSIKVEGSLFDTGVLLAALLVIQ